MEEFFGGLLLGLCVAIFVGMASCDGGTQKVRDEAVKAGVAEYYISPAPDFQKEFRWKK